MNAGAARAFRGGIDSRRGAGEDRTRESIQARMLRGGHT